MMETGVNCQLLASAATEVDRTISVAPSIMSSPSTQPSNSQSSDLTYYPNNSEEMDFEEDRLIKLQVYKFKRCQVIMQYDIKNQQTLRQSR